MKRMLLILCSGGALLLQTSCNVHREADAPPPHKTPQVRDIAEAAAKYKVRPGGEALPPPRDVAHPGAIAAVDQSLELMANIADAQDKIQNRVDAVEQKFGTFESGSEVQNKQLQDVTQRVAGMDAQLQQTKQQVAVASQQFEKRLAMLERTKDDHRSPGTVTARANLPQPTPAAPAPAATVTPLLPATESKAVAQTEAPAETKPAGFLEKFLDETDEAHRKIAPTTKFTPYEQDLRNHVRAVYQKVLSTYADTPAVLDADIGLASLAEQEEDWPQVIASNRHIIEHFPDAPQALDAHANLAHALMVSSKPEEARKEYLTLADSFPHDSHAGPALLAAADCLTQMGKTKEALNEYRTIEHGHPGTEYARTAQEHEGDIHVKNKAYPEAIECYARAAALDSQNTPIAMKLAEVQILAGKNADARTTLMGLMGPRYSDNVHATAQYGIARSYDEEGDMLSAARGYASAADQHPKASFAIEARLKCAQCFLAVEMVDHANDQVNLLLKNLLEAPYEVREQYEPQALCAGIRAMRLGNDKEGVQKRLDQLHRDWPASDMTTVADLEEAELLDQNGKGSEAVAILKEIMRTQPNSPASAQAMIKIAEIQERSTDLKRGAALYDEMLHMTVNSERAAQIKIRRAFLLQQLGREGEAREIFSGLTAEPKNPMLVSIAMYQVALMDQRSGKLDDAIKGFEKLLTVNANETNAEIADLLHDAKWKVEKLKWLSNLQKERDELPAVPAVTKAHS